MSAQSTAVKLFSEYLTKARRRERWRFALGFIALTVLLLSVLTLAGAWLGLYRGFTPQLDLLIRGIMVLSVLICGVLLLWRPLGKLASDDGAMLVESSDAAFDGRVHTFLDTHKADPAQPFLSLLARDALSVAKRVPLKRIVPTSLLVWPVVLLVLVFSAGAGFVQVAPPTWKNAALHVWWGWKDRTLVDPRVIDVQPGSIELLAGEDLNLDIELLGFTEEQVTLHARAPDEQQWQSSQITASPDGRFRFKMFRVNEALNYYVEAGFTQSPEFEVSVVQPPRLQSIDVEYVYPEWTQLPDVSRDDVTNISAVKDTRITLTFTLDKALNDGLLMLGDETLPMSETAIDDGVQYTARFSLQNDTDYQLLDRMLDREVPISDVHAVIVRGDEAPEVKFLSPGRDVSASPVEEVSVSVEARDDFAIESVELLYSVNAGPWQSVVLDSTDVYNHVFYLESMGSADEASILEMSPDEEMLPEQMSPDEALEGESLVDEMAQGEMSQDDIASDEISSDELSPDALAPDASESIAVVTPMQPGDLISYYVRVSDHDSSTETDMMLIDVRPFERRFSEGQSGGGGGGGGGGSANEGSEISQRQKEIFLATWNLQRSTEAAQGDTTGHEDNARLLSELQRTLAEQARTLADRSEARELVNQGEEIRQFVEYLREAAQEMEPSALALDALAFNDAIQPQQKALQLLQRAEALFADIRLTQQEASQGGGGQQAGQDMAEMFELEMDLERNQYEQPDRGGNAGNPQEQLDDVFEELAELARRQQALAEAEQQRESLTREEQWQQQQLARDIEELQRELEQLQRDAANAEGSEGEALQQAASELSEQLEQAQEALEQSQERSEARENAQGGEGGEESDGSTQSADADQAQDADGSDQQTGEQMGEQTANDGEQQEGEPGGSVDEPSATQAANDALQQALEGLGNARAQDLQDGIDEASQRAAELLDVQRDLEQVLREAVERAVRARENGVFGPGLERDEMLELAQQKRQLQRELETLRDDVQDLENRFGEQAPQTGEALEVAIERLDESRSVEMLGIGGEAISNGSLATVLPGESLITNSLREWRDRLDDAAEAAANEELQIRDDEDLQVADALDQLRELRDRLGGGSQQPQGESGEQGENGQQGEGGQQAENGQQGEGGQQGESGQQGEGGQQGESGQQGEGGQQGENGQQGEGGQQGENGQRGEGGQQGESGQQGEGGQQGENGQQGEGGQQGQNGQQGQGGQQGENGQQGQGGQTGQSGGDSQPNGAQGTGLASSNRSGDGRQDGLIFERSAQETADALEDLVPQLDAAGVSAETLQSLRDSAALLRSDGGEINAQRVEAEYRNILRQIEQLEVQIANNASAESDGIDALVRQGEISDTAADYYRRLSEQPLRLQR